MTIETSRGAKPDEAFTAIVHVKNPTHKTLRGVNVSLAALADRADAGQLDDYQVAEGVEVTPETQEMYIAKLAPGAEKTFRFQVKPTGQRAELTLRSYAYAEYGGAAQGDATLGAAPVAPQPAADDTVAVHFAEPPAAKN